jgi:hypothetical protein
MPKKYGSETAQERRDREAAEAYAKEQDILAAAEKDQVDAGGPPSEHADNGDIVAPEGFWDEGDDEKVEPEPEPVQAAPWHPVDDPVYNKPAF